MIASLKMPNTNFILSKNGLLTLSSIPCKIAITVIIVNYIEE